MRGTVYNPSVQIFTQRDKSTSISQDRRDHPRISVPYTAKDKEREKRRREQANREERETEKRKIKGGRKREGLSEAERVKNEDRRTDSFEGLEGER